MRTGVCYYPEHWPETRWTRDAAHMRELGLSVVRIGEFAWSRLESADGQLHFDWLRRAIDVLHEAGLAVVLGTPTATPPRWLLDRHPDMLAVDEHGHTRGFGSRRHYCFSSTRYREECRRIVTLLGETFGQHPGVVAWQIDNEYGCHSTTLSYSTEAHQAFQQWCEARYGDIGTLNSAWGNVFWSQEYDRFEQIGLPSGAVTECNPAQRLAFWRFSSDQVVSFNALQCEILRERSPGRDLIHNFMGNFVEFDHHAVSRDLDVASWDNYPLGFLDRDAMPFDDSEGVDHRQRYLRTGHPDGSSFHHDLYRGCCDGRWWLMEQQPGPVNWAPHNPAPTDGMVRLWGWEAFAHGAEVVSWFRWRQAPFAQEQMHTGLLLPDGSEDTAAGEARRLNEEVERVLALPELARSAADAIRLSARADVAIIVDYVGIAAQDIQQPDGRTYSALGWLQRMHSACRRLALEVDLISPEAPLDDYALILVGVSTISDAALVARLQACDATIVLGPRTGSKTDEYAIPDSLPPGEFDRLLDLRVTRVESLPPTEGLSAHGGQAPIECAQWRERVDSHLSPRARFEDGWGFHYCDGRVHYLNALPNQASLLTLLRSIAEDAGLQSFDLGTDLRVRRTDALCFAFNYGPNTITLDEAFAAHFNVDVDGRFVIGKKAIPAAGVAAWLVHEVP